MSRKTPQLQDPSEQPALRRHRLRNALVALALAALFALGALIVVESLRDSARSAVEAYEPVAPKAVTVSDRMDDTPPESLDPVEPVHVRLMMVGDILMHMGIVEGGQRADGSRNYEHLFAPIAQDVAEADVAALNQETILGGTRWAFSGYPMFNSPQEVGDAEAAVGFDVILKATNHTLDMGYDGVRAELAYWAQAHPQMAVIGMADPDGNHVAPAGGTSPAGAYLYEKDGFRIALLNYTDVLNGNVDPAFDGNVVSILTEEGLRADVAAAREQGEADLVVVFAHWGEEYETTPVESERRWAQVMQDAGVDVVIGGHPHVIQPVEVLEKDGHKMLVCWSVGNFVSTQNGAANMVGGMVKLDLVKDVDGARVEAYEFVPTVTQHERGTTNMCAYKLSDYTDELAARSGVSAVDGGRGSTKAWYVEFCAEVLGASFDRDTLSVHGTM